MKVIILASSIFYLLGLKISNNVDIVKKSKITPVIENKLENTPVNNDINDDKKTIELKAGPDSLNISGVITTEKTIKKET